MTYHRSVTAACKAIFHAVLVILFSGVVLSMAQTGTTQSDRKILFVSDRTKNKEIFVMDEYGAHQVQLTRTNYGNWAPKWSPVGNSIVFFSNRDGNFQIYTMLNDGTRHRRLRVNEFSETDPSYSPHGDRIAFASTATGTRAIWAMNDDGTNAVCLTPGEIDCGGPQWSPDGMEIVYQRKVGNRLAICVVPARGGPSKVIASGDFDLEQPSWSPKGDMVSYVKTVNIYIPEIRKRRNVSSIFIIRRVNEAWGKPFKITTRGNNTHPSWFPDGRQLAYQSDRNHYGKWSLFTSQWDGKQQKRVAEMLGEATHPSVSPDGTKIIYAYFMFKASKMAVYDLTTRQITQIANPAYDHAGPRWAVKYSEFLFSCFPFRHALISRGNLQGMTTAMSDEAPGDMLNVSETPDERFYVFSLVKGGVGQIYLMDQSNRRLINLSNSMTDDRCPVLSPDGLQIYFERRITAAAGGRTEGSPVSKPDPSADKVGPGRTTTPAAGTGNIQPLSGSKIQIYRMTMDGEFPTLISDGQGNDRWTTISPDGEMLAFQSDRDGNDEIYLYFLRDRTLRRITTNTDWDGQPCFSGDGNEIAFVSKRDKRSQIYRVKIDGSAQTNISNNLWNDEEPSWR